MTTTNSAGRILDESGPLFIKPDLIILMIRIEELMPQFIDNFGSSQYAAWGEGH